MSWLALDKIVRMFLNVFVGSWVARYLAPDRFGMLSFAIALLGIFIIIASLGLDGIVIRDIVKKDDIVSVTLGTAFVLKLCGGFIALLLAVCLIPMLVHGDSTMFWLVIVLGAAVFPQALDVIDYFFQSQVQSKFMVYARFIAFVAASALKVGLIISKAGLIAFGIATLVETILAALCLVIIYLIRGNKILNWSWNTIRAKELIHDSWPLILSGITVLLFMRVDQIMIAKLANYSEVGIYSSAVRIVEAFAFVPTVILSSVYPLMVDLKSKDTAGYIAYSLRLFKLINALGIIIALIIVVSSKEVIAILLGSGYAAARMPLILLSFGCVFTFSGSVRAQLFIINNQTIYHTYNALIGLVVLVPLNFVMIPAFGASGAACSVAICYFITGILSSFMFRETRYIGKIQIKALLFR